MLKSDKTC